MKIALFHILRTLVFTFSVIAPLVTVFYKIYKGQYDLNAFLLSLAFGIVGVLIGYLIPEPIKTK